MAQAAAVLGRDFDRALLAEVLPHESRALGEALDTIVASRLMVRRTGGCPDALQFKHALVRDAAYDSLLSVQREALHAQVAAALIARSEAGGDIAPELIAQHLAKGGALAQAIPYWARAGEQATRKSANREAVSHISSGLAALDALTDDEARARCELELQLALGTPLIAVSGYTAAATVEAYARARELAERLGDPDGLFQALYGVWVNDMIRGRLAQAHAIAERLVSLALWSASSAQEVTARRVLGFCLALLGRSRSPISWRRRCCCSAATCTAGSCSASVRIRASLPCRCWPGSPACRATGRRATGSPPRRYRPRTSSAIRIPRPTPPISPARLRAFSWTTCRRRTVISMRSSSFPPMGLPVLEGIRDGLRAALAAREGRTAEARAGLRVLRDPRRPVGLLVQAVLFAPGRGFLHAGDRPLHPATSNSGLATMEQTGERSIEPHLRRLRAATAEPRCRRDGQPASQSGMVSRASISS